MLFMGDAGRETEERLLADGDDLRADVLKVGHHGSAYGTTPEFLRAVAPHVAIISVGRNNLFGHPAPTTIEALRDAGIATYRTDRDGAVRVESDGNGFSANAFLTSPNSSARGCRRHDRILRRRPCMQHQASGLPEITVPET